MSEDGMPDPQDSATQKESGRQKDWPGKQASPEEFPKSERKGGFGEETRWPREERPFDVLQAALGNQALLRRAAALRSIPRLGDHVDFATAQAALGNQALARRLSRLQSASRQPTETQESGRSASTLQAIASRGTSGSPVPLPHRERIQESFGGHDVGTVEAFVGGPAKQASEAMGAEAYAYGGKAAFRQAPDLKTAAHEAAHVVQQRGGVQMKGGVGAAGDACEPHADAVADRVVAGQSAEDVIDQFGDGSLLEKRAESGSPEATVQMQRSGFSGPPAGQPIQLSRASDLVGEFKSWNPVGDKPFGLDHMGLGRKLANQALREDAALFGEVLDVLGSWSTDRDDVSYGFISALTNVQLSSLVDRPDGRAALHRAFDELTSGWVSDSEKAQADRVLNAEVSRVKPADWDMEATSGPVIPYGAPGMLAFGASPVMAQRRPGDRIWVKITVNQGYSQLTSAEMKRTPADIALGGIELPANRIVVIKRLDEGGAYDPKPAIHLLEIAHETNRATATTAFSAVVLGATLPFMGAASAGSQAVRWLVAAGLTAETAIKVVTIADSAALILGLLTGLIHDNRGWVIKSFGEDGRRFVQATDVIGTATVVYGFARVAVEMPRVVQGFRNSVASVRQRLQSASAGLDAGESKAAKSIEENAQKLLDKVDEVDRARAPQATAVPAKEAPPEVADGSKSVPAQNAPQGEPKIEGKSKVGEIGTAKPPLTKADAESLITPSQLRQATPALAGAGGGARGAGAAGDGLPATERIPNSFESRAIGPQAPGLGSVGSTSAGAASVETLGIEEVSLSERFRRLRGIAKDAEWVSPAQGEPGPGLRDHAAKHAEQVGAQSVREYDLSARETIQGGRRFRYRDPTTNQPRVGYWDPETGLFTATNVTRKTPTILTHFPLTWQKIKTFPGFTMD